MRPVRARVADALEQVGLSRPVFRIWQRLQALGARGSPNGDGLPTPPAYLRVLTAGSADADVFLAQGRAAAEEILRLADDAGPPSTRVLEFGVGCGRVARWTTRLRPDAAFDGCDIDGRLLDWSKTHLPGRYALTAPEPPLPYPNGAFDLVYALSVFTHMHEPQAKAWLAELARVTRPGGLAILSFLDDRLPQAADVQPRLTRDGFAVRREGEEGSNLLCGYFTADGFAERAAPHWTPLRSLGSDVSATAQAQAVFRRA